MVAVGGGFAYGAQGYTHHGVEDLGVMRALPGMTVVAPGDPVEARLATRALCDLPGPAYLRLGKAGEPEVHAAIRRRFPRSARRSRSCEGGDVTIISTGGMLRHAVDVAEALRTKDGVKARVLSMHTVKPLDVEAVARAAEETGAIVTVEEHNVSSGLGSVVAQALATMPGRKPAFRAYGVPDEPYSRLRQPRLHARDDGRACARSRRCELIKRDHERDHARKANAHQRRDPLLQRGGQPRGLRAGAARDLHRSCCPTDDLEQIFCDNASTDGSERCCGAWPRPTRT